MQAMNVFGQVSRYYDYFLCNLRLVATMRGQGQPYSPQNIIKRYPIHFGRTTRDITQSDQAWRRQAQSPNVETGHGC